MQKQAINDLNVFPVPDGDTGTNMSLTIQTAAAELKKCEPATVGEAAKITASALLRGARGNSGVILSLLFRGSPSPSRDWRRWTAYSWRAAMSRGRDHGLRRRDEARRGYGADGIPSGGGQS